MYIQIRLKIKKLNNVFKITLSFCGKDIVIWEIVMNENSEYEVSTDKKIMIFD